MSGNNYPRVVKRLSRLLSDRWYIQLRYLMRFKRLCNFRNPTTYNEKLQWLKLNYRVAGQSSLVDKFEVKAWVAGRIGSEYVIPTLALYESVDEIDLGALPDSFVLKCTHDSGGLVLARDKSALDMDEVREKLGYTMERSYFYSGREPQYLGVRPRIIAEPYLEDETHGQLLDYKFFCFDGEVKAMFVASDRATEMVKFDYFDPDFNLLGLRQPYPNSAVPPSKPECYDEMLDLARTLSEGHPHVRVDLYEVDGKVYFGEMTFFHFGGMQPFVPAKWDRIWGEWLKLPVPVRDF